jgi:hypothetical protein
LTPPTMRGSTATDLLGAHSRGPTVRL